MSIKNNNIDNYIEELNIIATNIKSNIILFQKQIQEECKNYNKSLVNNIKDFEQSIVENINTKNKLLSQELNNKLVITSKAIDEKISSSLRILKSEINEQISLQEIKLLLDELKSNFKNDINDNLKEIRDLFFIKISESIDEKYNIIISNINNDSNELEKKFTEYVRQLQYMIDESLSSIDTKTNDSLEQIYSAEQTSIENILNMKLQAIDDIKLTIDGIDITINSFMNSAKEEINEHKENAINEINGTKASIKQIIEMELEKSSEVLNNLASELSDNLENKKNSLEEELIIKANELLNQFDEFELEVRIELDKIKQDVMAEFTRELSEFFTVMSTREQEIIANIMTATSGFKEELEAHRLETYNDFLNDINQIVEEKINTFSILIDNCLKSLNDEFLKLKQQLIDHTNDVLIIQLNNKKEEIVRIINDVKDDSVKKIGETDDSMYDEDTPSVRKAAIDSINSLAEDIINTSVSDALKAIQKYINNIKEQRYSVELENNINEIILPEDFILNSRHQVFLDGTLLIINKHYTISLEENKIILNNPTIGKTDFTIIDHIQDSELESIKEKFYEEVRRKLNESINVIKETEKESKTQIYLTQDDVIKRIGEEDDSMYDEVTPSIRKNAIDAIIKVYNNSVDSIVDSAVEKLKEYIEQLDEQIFVKTLSPGDKEIIIPKEFCFNSKNKVFLDGIMQIENRQYTVDLLKNKIILNKPIIKSTEFVIIDNVPIENLSSIKENFYTESENLLNQYLTTIEENKNQGILEINTLFEEINNNLKNDIDQYIKDEISNYSTQRMVTSITNDTNKITIPVEIIISDRVLVFADGILLTENLEYFLNKEERTIEFVKKYNTDVIFNIIIDAPTNGTINYYQDYTEFNYYVNIPKTTKEIILPFQLYPSLSLHLFADGIKQIKDITYTIDMQLSKIIFIEPFEKTTDIEIVVTNNKIINLLFDLKSEENILNIDSSINLKEYCINLYMDGIKKIQNKDFNINYENNQITFNNYYENDKNIEIILIYKGVSK